MSFFCRVLNRFGQFWHRVLATRRSRRRGTRRRSWAWTTRRMATYCCCSCRPSCPACRSSRPPAVPRSSSPPPRPGSRCRRAPSRSPSSQWAPTFSSKFPVGRCAPGVAPPLQPDRFVQGGKLLRPGNAPELGWAGSVRSRIEQLQLFISSSQLESWKTANIAR